MPPMPTLRQQTLTLLAANPYRELTIQDICDLIPSHPTRNTLSRIMTTMTRAHEVATTAKGWYAIDKDWYNGRHPDQKLDW